MQALLFEVEPLEGQEDLYFKRAAALKPRLADHPGLLFLDRYRSLSRPNVILSHQFWLDEAAIAKWRADGPHYQAQVSGRNKHFKDYRIRVGHCLFRKDADSARHRFDASGRYLEHPLDRYLLITRTDGKPGPSIGECFESVNIEDSHVTIAEYADQTLAIQAFETQSTRDNVVSAALCLVTRDYSMMDRAEAPQYFPPIKQEAGAPSAE